MKNARKTIPVTNLPDPPRRLIEAVSRSIRLTLGNNLHRIDEFVRIDTRRFQVSAYRSGTIFRIDIIELKWNQKRLDIASE